MLRAAGKLKAKLTLHLELIDICLDYVGHRPVLRVHLFVDDRV